MALPTMVFIRWSADALSRPRHRDLDLLDAGRVPVFQRPVVKLVLADQRADGIVEPLLDLTGEHFFLGLDPAIRLERLRRRGGVRVGEVERQDRPSADRAHLL